MKLRYLPLYLITFVCVATAASAQEDGLYAPPPPPGSAFVHFINGDAQPSGGAEAHGKAFPGVEPGGVGDYLPVPNGETPVTMGGVKTMAMLKAGAHYAAILQNGKLSVLEEPPYDGKLKAQIILVNLTAEKSVALKSGSVAVIDEAAPGTLKARAVNALKVGFTVTAGARKIADLDPRPLERGGSYAVVVYKGADGKPAAAIHESAQP